MDGRLVSALVFLAVFLVPMTVLFVWRFLVPILRQKPKAAEAEPTGEAKTA
jgi:hypothetical protein